MNSNDQINPIPSICRLCIQFCTEYPYPITCLKDLLNTVLPNLDTNLTENPVVCGKCVESLTQASNFITICMEKERTIWKHYNKVKTTIDLFNLVQSHQNCDITQNKYPNIKNNLSEETKIENKNKDSLEISNKEFTYNTNTEITCDMAVSDQPSYSKNTPSKCDEMKNDDIIEVIDSDTDSEDIKSVEDPGYNRSSTTNNHNLLIEKRVEQIVTQTDVFTETLVMNSIDDEEFNFKDAPEKSIDFSYNNMDFSYNNTEEIGSQSIISEENKFSTKREKSRKNITFVSCDTFASDSIRSSKKRKKHGITTKVVRKAEIETTILSSNNTEHDVGDNLANCKKKKVTNLDDSDSDSRNSDSSWSPYRKPTFKRGKKTEPSALCSTYKCMFCAKTFKQIVQRNCHLLSKHKDEPDIETNIKGTIHYCRYCPYRSVYNINVVSHTNRKHQRNNDEIHFCDFCSFKTLRLASYLEHMKKHGNVVTWQNLN